mmetsp:Transcript_18806/g.18472  ORF Transcript_18806/g.18472 Transcript_18806/m.18472 type:complete len:93 (-) Transcript_18806:12-290(-)
MSFCPNPCSDAEILQESAASAAVRTSVQGSYSKYELSLDEEEREEQNPTIDQRNQFCYFQAIEKEPKEMEYMLLNKEKDVKMFLRNRIKKFE